MHLEVKRSSPETSPKTQDSCRNIYTAIESAEGDGEGNCVRLQEQVLQPAKFITNNIQRFVNKIFVIAGVEQRLSTKELGSDYLGKA